MNGFTEGTLACMKAAYDCGINFFDTAEVYAEGESEIVMGEAIKEFGWKRNDLVISTKVSNPVPSQHHPTPRERPADGTATSSTGAARSATTP